MSKQNKTSKPEQQS